MRNGDVDDNDDDDNHILESDPVVYWYRGELNKDCSDAPGYRCLKRYSDF